MLLCAGSIPSSLFALTKLKQLDLNNNTLTGSINGIENLVDLRFLQIHGNQFTGEIPSQFPLLTNLSKFLLHL